MKSLYEITQDALELASYLQENDGEINEEIESLLIINQNELQNKAINYAYAIKTIENDIDYIDNEVKRLQSLKKAKCNAVDRMKDAISNAMELYNIEKVDTPTMTLSFRKSESVEVHNEEIIPVQFLNVKEVRTVNKTKIKEAIKNGENVFGATLQINNNLQIK
jgi:hypothetical protein